MSEVHRPYPRRLTDGPGRGGDGVGGGLAMLGRVISGGQTGADQAGLRAARAAGLTTGGFAPLGWETEAGPASWLADWGLTECRVESYPYRTRADVVAADATLIFGNPLSAGSTLTAKTCEGAGRPYLRVGPGVKPSEVVAFLRRREGVKPLNVAGDRESSNPGIGDRVERFLAADGATMAARRLRGRTPAADHQPGSEPDGPFFRSAPLSP